MFNLASSLLYSSLFNQTNNGEQVYEGSATAKAPTYNLGVKGIPDDVVWALSAVNLDQYELPEWVTRDYQIHFDFSKKKIFFSAKFRLWIFFGFLIRRKRVWVTIRGQTCTFYYPGDFSFLKGPKLG